MLRFLETHDEQRIASSFFATDPTRALPAMVVTATLHTGPYLVYFGQEVGVQAEEAEGFSGHDGRTTIFDYWGLTDWQGYVNGHRYDGAGLTNEQSALRAFYESWVRSSANRRRSERARFTICSGLTKTIRGYNQHRIYSYVRYSDSEKLLIVCNFDDTNALSTTIRVPEDALT
jgi:glycosidase